MQDAEIGSLVKAAADGDKDAWRALVGQFSGLVWSITRAYRLGDADAADVCQTAWLRLAENIHRLNHPERVGAWLATATRRECLRNIRVSARTVPAEDMTWFDVPDDDNPTEEAVLAAEREREAAQRGKALRRALGQLSARCRQLLRVLMASPPPSYTDVAAALDMPVGSIGPTRARCLDRLRNELATGIKDGPTPSYE
ncbi:MAG TPA: sigma-70 family RNA polymerase sigma factor [Streptosporangiaceae bacterium]|nr:sigma-70 family RNA polymerase sigma factor [Streptosporangiaceae bacterium]